jgi:hypothetical protein
VPHFLVDWPVVPTHVGVNRCQSIETSISPSCPHARGSEPPTAAMSDIYESYDDKLRQYTQHFTVTQNQKGFLVEVNGKIMGLEIFDSHDSLGHYFDKLIQSYALDALDLSMQGQTPPKNRAKVDNWLREVTGLPLPAPGQPGKISGDQRAHAFCRR